MSRNVRDVPKSPTQTVTTCGGQSGTRLARPAAMKRVLLTSDDLFFQNALANRLGADGNLVITCAPSPRLGAIVAAMRVDVVVVDDVSPVFPAGTFLAGLLGEDAPPVVLLTDRRLADHVRRTRLVVLYPPFHVDLVAAAVCGLGPQRVRPNAVNA